MGVKSVQHLPFEGEISVLKPFLHICRKLQDCVNGFIGQATVCQQCFQFIPACCESHIAIIQFRLLPFESFLNNPCCFA